jgi:pyruvate,water dikinase
MTQQAAVDQAFNWEDPSHEALWWMRDQMHFPRPLHPYTASVERAAMASGCTAGFQTLGVPMRMHIATLLGYQYAAAEMLDPDREAWMPAVQANVMERLAGLLGRWRDTWLPEVLSLNGRLRDFAYASASAAELIAQIDESVRIRERSWDIHMQVTAPVVVIADEFANQWEAAFGPERRDEALALLQGFANKTMEAGAALWKLSREALVAPDVAKLILDTPVKRIAPLLGTTDAGRAFREKLDVYLRTYGWRSGAFDYADPAWIEDPSVVLSTLRDFLRQPEDADPARHAAHAAAERQALEARVGPEIDALPQGPILRTMLTFAHHLVT